MARIVAVDGCSVTRRGLKEFLSATCYLRVVGETGDGAEAVRLVEEARPDLMVIGLNLVGEPDGVEVCRRVKDLPEAPYVLVYTACDYARDVADCLLAGADSFLRRSEGHEEFIDIVRRTTAGESVWLLGGRNGERSYLRAVLQEGKLTPREKEVFRLLAHRRCNTEIAEELYIGQQTAKNYVSNILRKLGVKRRKDLYRLLEEGR